MELDGLTLDPQTYEVGWRQASVRLTPTEFRILYLLATNAGKVVPASRIYTYVWGSQGGDANALRSHISHLRHKLALEVGGDVPGTVLSVPAVGYIFRRSSKSSTSVAAAATETAPAAAETPGSLAIAPAAAG